MMYFGRYLDSITFSSAEEAFAELLSLVDMHYLDTQKRVRISL